MNGIDYFFFAIVTLSALLGIFRGLVREVFSIIAWLSAFFAAKFFAADAASVFQSIAEREVIRYFISFVAIFVSTLLVCGFLSFLCRKLVQALQLGVLDRVLGLVFGFLRGLLLVLILVFLARFTGISHSKLWQSAKTVPIVEKIVMSMHGLFPNELMEYWKKGQNPIKQKEIAV